MKNPDRLKELILAKVDLAQVMLDYGTHFMYSPLHTEEAQFRCPFHGNDNKPSARYYRSTQTCYCWVCAKRWVVISFIKDKESLNFYSTLNFVVKKYQLDTSSIPEGVEFQPLKSKEKEVSDQRISFIYLKNRIRDFRGKISFERYRALCCFYQMAEFKASQDIDVTESLKKLELKIEGL